jgi:hypothetical protein
MEEAILMHLVYMSDYMYWPINLMSYMPMLAVVMSVGDTR